jgi:hypothetical protein
MYNMSHNVAPYSQKEPGKFDFDRMLGEHLILKVRYEGCARIDNVTALVCRLMA